jgi:hypothetical protein
MLIQSLLTPVLLFLVTVLAPHPTVVRELVLRRTVLQVPVEGTVVSVEMQEVQHTEARHNLLALAQVEEVMIQEEAVLVAVQ